MIEVIHYFNNNLIPISGSGVFLPYLTVPKGRLSFIWPNVTRDADKVKYLLLHNANWLVLQLNRITSMRLSELLLAGLHNL